MGEVSKLYRYLSQGLAYVHHTSSFRLTVWVGLLLAHQKEAIRYPDKLRVHRLGGIPWDVGILCIGIH